MSKTLSKALYLLTLFEGEEQYFTVDELAKLAGIPRTTTYRLLKSLEENGFVRKASSYGMPIEQLSDVYQLGLRCLRLGARAASQIDTRNIALPYMKRIRDQLNLSVQLIISENDEAIYIEKVESNRPVRLYTSIGRKAPLYAGACPRMLLSFMEDDEIRRILSRQLVKVTDSTFTDKAQIWDMIHSTRKNGYSYSLSELAENTSAIATPIFDRNNKIEAALSVGNLVGELGTEASVNMDIVHIMWEASEKVSLELGYIGPYPYNNRK